MGEIYLDKVKGEKKIGKVLSSSIVSVPAFLSLVPLNPQKSDCPGFYFVRVLSQC